MRRHKQMSEKRRLRLIDLAKHPEEKFTRVLEDMLAAAPGLRAAATVALTDDLWENLGRSVVALRAERRRRRRARAA